MEGIPGYHRIYVGPRLARTGKRKLPGDFNTEEIRPKKLRITLNQASFSPYPGLGEVYGWAP